MLAVEDFLEGDFLAGVGGHAAHAGDEAGFDTALGLVIRLVVADGIHQIVPFVQIGILLACGDFGGPEQFRTIHGLAFEYHGRTGAVVGFGDDGHAFAAVRVAGINVVAAVDAAAIHVHLGAVGK